MIKKVIALLLTVLMTAGLALPVCAAGNNEQTEKTDIKTLDIGVRPSHYKNLVSNEAETLYPIRVKSSDSEYIGASIKTRGYSSKITTIGFDPHRVPLEIKFSEKKDALLFDNTSLKLINSYTPFRLIAEYLGLELFEYCGIPTPEHSFVFLRFNDVDFGLYIAVEDVNDEFISKHFSDSEGLLCKSNSGKAEISIDTMKWFGKLYAKSGNYNTNSLQSLIDALEQNRYYGKYLDIESTIKFFACTAVLGSHDSILSYIMNNFLLYENEGKFQLIPWDLSDSFYCFSDGNGIDSVNNGEYTTPLFSLLMSNPKNRELYHQYINEINDTFFAPERIEPLVRSIVGQLEPYFARDVSMSDNDESTVQRLLSGNTLYNGNLLNVMSEVRRQVDLMLDNKINSFYIPKGYESLVLSTDLEYSVNQLKESFKGDPDIVQKICDGYNGWKSRYAQTTESIFTKKDFLIALIIFTAAFPIVLFLRRWIRLLRFKNRVSTNN